MDNMKMHSPNLVDEHIEKIAELFPNCITESRDEDGNIKKTVDFDFLRQELSDSIVEGPQERYHLNWPGKREALLTANAPIAKTLRPYRKESVNFDTTENLFIEGDNLDTLKLLQETYLGKIKMIYIDPPYNTGSDFIYKDDFVKNTKEYMSSSKQIDEEGNQLLANTESNGRFHSDWLSMMYPRLKVALNLLKDDGVMFISIDDHELHNLRKICDEVFGENNFLTCIAVKLSEATGVKMSHAKNRIPKLKEYILIYKKKDRVEINPSLMDKNKWDYEYRTYCYGLSDEELDILKNIIRNENRTKKEISIANDLLKKISFENISSVCQRITGKEVDDAWCFSNANRIVQFVTMTGGARDLAVKRKHDLKKVGELPSAFSIVTSNNKMYAINSAFNDKSELPRCKILFADEYLKTNTGDFWFDIKTTGLDNEGFVDFKNGKKPLKLIKRCISLVCNKDDIILDFFAGSGTTAQAILELNSTNNSKFKFILAQLPEVVNGKNDEQKSAYNFCLKNDLPFFITEIAKERIRRAGKKVLEGECHEEWNKDVGFRVLKVDCSNMKDIYYSPVDLAQKDLPWMKDNIKDDRTPEDLLFQVLLDWGVEPTLPINKERIEGLEVFFVDEDALAACFDDEGGITEGFIKELAERKPLRAVFRDAGFKDDSIRINTEQIFKSISPNTEVKTI